MVVIGVQQVIPTSAEDVVPVGSTNNPVVAQVAKDAVLTVAEDTILDLESFRDIKVEEILRPINQELVAREEFIVGGELLGPEGLET